MYYKYLGKEDIRVLREDRIYGIVVHAFEEIHPNGRGIKEKYGFLCHDWDFNMELHIYKFNGEVYTRHDKMPFNILEDLYKHRDLFHSI